MVPAGSRNSRSASPIRTLNASNCEDQGRDSTPSSTSSALAGSPLKVVPGTKWWSPNGYTICSRSLYPTNTAHCCLYREIANAGRRTSAAPATITTAIWTTDHLAGGEPPRLTMPTTSPHKPQRPASGRQTGRWLTITTAPSSTAQPSDRSVPGPIGGYLPCASIVSQRHCCPPILLTAQRVIAQPSASSIRHPALARAHANLMPIVVDSPRLCRSGVVCCRTYVRS